MKEKLFFALFAVAYTVLCVVLGAVAIYYKWPVAKPLSQAFEGGKAWYEVEKHNHRKSKRKSRPVTGSKRYDLSQRVKDLHIPPYEIKGYKKRKASKGYTVLSHYFSDDVILINMEGKILHQWHVPFSKAFPNPEHINAKTKAAQLTGDIHLYANGDILIQYSGLGDTPYGYGMALFNKNSERIWALDKHTHHLMHVSQDTHNIYVIDHSFIKDPVKGFEHLNYPQLLDNILEVSPKGRVLSEISILHAFQNTKYASLFKKETGRKKAKKWDALHTNSVQRLDSDLAAMFPMFKVGDYLVSIRNIQAIAVIRPETKKVVWAYKGTWDRQHAALFTKNGTIMLINNHAYDDGGPIYSSIMEVNPQDGGVKTTYAKKRKGRFFTYAWGQLQLLENGNIFAVESSGGRILEITSDNEIVWQYKSLIKDKWRKVISGAARYPVGSLHFIDKKR